jgi:hypothetical protein
VEVAGVFAPAHGMGPTATPVVSGGKVYTLGSMGRLFCLDAIDGQVLWEKDLIREYEAKEFDPVCSEDLLLISGLMRSDRNLCARRWKRSDRIFR